MNSLPASPSFMRSARRNQTKGLESSDNRVALRDGGSRVRRVGNGRRLRGRGSAVEADLFAGGSANDNAVRVAVAYLISHVCFLLMIGKGGRSPLFVG